MKYIVLIYTVDFRVRLGLDLILILGNIYRESIHSETDLFHSHIRQMDFLFKMSCMLFAVAVIYVL